MANPYYNTTGSPANQSSGSSAVMRGEFGLIADGFDLVEAAVAAGGGSAAAEAVRAITAETTEVARATAAEAAILADLAAETARAEAAETVEAARALIAEAAAYNNVGRNLIHNSMFRVQQRGAGPFIFTSSGVAAGGHTADRWLAFVQASGDTTTVNVVPPSTEQNRIDIGDEAMSFLLDVAFTGAAGANNAVLLVQRIEDLRRLAGKTVIVSFFANFGGAASMKIGVSMDQYFGSGGAPSPSVLGVGQAATLLGPAGKFARYAVTIAVPSIAGKTFGTVGDNSTQLIFWLSSGASFASRSGNIGAQSGTVNLWGVQLEVAQPGQTQPTPLEKPDPQQDLAKCQRFYVIRSAHEVAGAAVNGVAIATPYTFPVQMRSVPSVIYSLTTGGGYSGPVVLSASPDGFSGAATGTGSSYIAIASFTASAEL